MSAVPGKLALAGMLMAWCPGVFALNPALDVSQYAHTAWRFGEDFAKGEIRGMAQTSDGYLWLGTEFGVLRFDGVRVTPWQPPAGRHLPSNQVWKLLAARDGTLWIGTRKGLASWKNDQFQQYAELAGLAIFALVEDREGTIWVGGVGLPDGKLCEIRNGGVQCHPEVGGLGHGVFGMHEDAQGNLWVGLAAGVWRWKPGPPDFYPMPGRRNGIQGMADGADGALLVPTPEGVLRLANGKAQLAYRFPGSIRDISALYIFRDRDGGLWISTSGRGIVHMRKGGSDVFARSEGLTDDFVEGFFEDREGNIWVATLGGLDHFREFPVVSYSVNEGLSGAASGSVLGARDGSVWFGTTDGLDRLQGGQVTVYRQHRSGVTAGVREVGVRGLLGPIGASLFQDSRGRIWVSGPDGVGYLEDDRFIASTAPGGIANAFSEDAAGDLWIANLELGLFRLTPGSAVAQIPWTALGRGDPALRLAADPAQGGLWLGLWKGGVAYLRDGQVRASYSTADGLGEGAVDDLRFDETGALWAGTEGGLSRLKDGHIATLTSKNGLPCDTVHWTMEDNAGSVWLNMSCGLVRVARSEVEAWATAPDRTGRTIHATVFGSSDGVKSKINAGGYTPSVARSLDGKLWFVGMGGLSMIDPRHLPNNPLPPAVHVEQIIADRRRYAIGAVGGPLRLPPLVRDLQIDYTALSLVAPEKVRFRYKLEGRDQDWQDAGNRRQAFYNDLAPRSYRFRVIACNNSGVWNEAGATFDFAVAPAYYQTTWFRLMWVAALLALLGGTYRLRVLYLARQFNTRLEGRVAERTRIARDLHDTLLQSFQGVLLQFHTITYLLPEGGEARRKLEQVIEQARQAITEGRDAVQGLRSSTVVTNDLARAIMTFGEGLAADQNGRDAPDFRVHVEGASRDLPPMLRDEVYRIIGEALRNAFRHSGAKRIEVEIHYDKRQLRVRIRDDGKGIDQHVRDAGGLAGHHGLPGMLERAQVAGGKLTIWSEVDSGTEMELTIPAGIAYAKIPAARRPEASI